MSWFFFFLFFCSEILDLEETIQLGITIHFTCEIWSLPVKSEVITQAIHCLKQQKNVYREMGNSHCKRIYYPRRGEYFALTKKYCSF